MNTQNRPTPEVANGFQAEPAENGGWIVRSRSNSHPGDMLTTTASFTNAQDMVGWIADQYSVPQFRTEWGEASGTQQP